MTDKDVVAMHILAAIIAAQAHPPSDGAIPVKHEAAVEMAAYAYTYADPLFTVKGGI